MVKAWWRWTDVDADSILAVTSTLPAFSAIVLYTKQVSKQFDTLVSQAATASPATCHTAKLAKGKALHLPQCRLISAVLSGTDRSTLPCPQRGGPTHLLLERERESRQRQKEGVKQGEINERSKNMISLEFLVCGFDGAIATDMS